MNFLFASTAFGLEELLKTELANLGALELQTTQGGVYYQGDTELLYKSLIWSRLASRVLLQLNTGLGQNAQDLYRYASAIDWPALFDSHHTFFVHFSGVTAEIRHSQFGAQTVKDAVVDRFKSQDLPRPSVDREQPDIHIRVRIHREKIGIFLDLGGGSLHQRGYRRQAGEAPIKENLAAAIVQRSGWQTGTPLIDPMCGSGTLLIEAAMMACDYAPGLSRRHWGFTAWKQHQPDCWQRLISAAEIRAQEGKSKAKRYFFGYDKDPLVLEYARKNAHLAGVEAFLVFEEHELSELKNPFPPTAIGTVICNPPYGERLEHKTTLMALYSQLGQIVKTQFGGWTLSLFTASPELLDNLQLRASRQFKAQNGSLDAVQKNYSLSKPSSSPSQPKPAESYARRLLKNVKKLVPWARREGIECYRLYDADLPEYNLALDRYAEWVVLQEYAPPKSIDPVKARRRLLDAVAATLQTLELPANRLIVKTRERQRGSHQYQKIGERGEFLRVKEYHAHFLVNLTDYLDTGLFLDHRIARRHLGELSQGKDFLNLFAYSGSASVYAGLGGAKSTTTVDLSRTYLQWAERNMQLNRLTGSQHRLIQADCFNLPRDNSWLRDGPKQFDVIFVDPPTFSNSKRMKEHFDVQKDHVRLLTDLKPLLRSDGVIVFSNNKQGFTLDHDALSKRGLTARNITEKTQSRDFSRNRYIHHCWMIKSCDQYC